MNLDQIKERYSEPHRFYHTWNHIEYMFKTAEKEGVEITEPLEHLIYCHDVIYIPGNSDNEKLSGAVASDYYTEVCNEYEETQFPFAFVSFDWEPITYYPLIINMTKNHIVDFGTESTEGMIWNWLDVAQNLIDLDLAILGDTWEVYQEYASNVRKEYAHVTDEQWKAGRGKWLSDMIGRKSIYYTDWGKKREDQAIKNMMKELKDFGFIDFSLLLVK